MAGGGPAEYASVLRVLKQEQKNNEKANEQILKYKEEIVLLKRGKTDTAAKLQQLSSEVKKLQSGNKLLEKKMEDMHTKFVASTRILSKGSVEYDETVEAPSGVVTWVFTDVQDSTPLWEISPQLMSDTLHIHDEIMRNMIKEHRAYEIRTQGDSFVIAFEDAVNAAKFCMDVQKQLHDVKWSKEVLAMHPSTSLVKDSHGVVMFNGLRVRMGIHTGTPDFCERDKVSKRMDYFGPAMNLAARVGGMPAGGQVLVSNAAWKEIQKDAEFMKSVNAVNLGNFQMKGLEQKQTLIQILPNSLQNRKFPSISPSAQSETKELFLNIEKMRVENLVVLEDIKKMQSTLRATQERCVLLQKNIADMRKDNLDADPKLLLAELALILVEQESLAELVEKTFDTTILVKGNLEMVDGKVKGQEVRIVEQTMLNLKKLISFVNNEITKRQNNKPTEMLLPVPLFPTPEYACITNIDDLQAMKNRLETQLQKGQDADVVVREFVESAPSNLLRKDVDMLVMRYDVSSDWENVTRYVDKLNLDIKEKDKSIADTLGKVLQLTNELNNYTKLTEKLKSRIKEKEVVVLDNRETIETLEYTIADLRKKLSEMPPPLQSPTPTPPIVKKRRNSISTPDEVIDIVKKMKIEMKKVASDHQISDQVKYLEGTTFQILNKKLTLVYAGSTLGTRQGGGFMKIEDWIKARQSSTLQQINSKEHLPSLTPTSLSAANSQKALSVGPLSKTNSLPTMLPEIALVLPKPGRKSPKASSPKGSSPTKSPKTGRTSRTMQTVME